MIKENNIPGMKTTRLLEGKDVVVRVAHDTYDDTYSLGVQTHKEVEFEVISKELHDLMIKELKKVK